MNPRDALKIDAAAAAAEIEDHILAFLLRMKRKGAVLGISGGVASSVVAALCARALGTDRVLGLFMPEADSSPNSLELGRLLADSLGIATALEDISGIAGRGMLHAPRRRDSYLLLSTVTDTNVRSCVPIYYRAELTSYSAWWRGLPKAWRLAPGCRWTHTLRWLRPLS